jgi:Fic-DOC domain mobile mystery protein B
LHFLAGEAEGQTPLDPDEAADLLRPAVSTRAELDIVEQENIAQAVQWAHSRRRSSDNILDEGFVRRLHREMFGDVWRWAGHYRQGSRNIGVDAWRIQQEIGQLIGNARYWVEHSIYEVEELCVRFHHGLVFIHPFPNGNGRHARLSADVLAVSLGVEPFGWGRGLGLETGPLRAHYIEALRVADANDFEALMTFAMS